MITTTDLLILAVGLLAIMVYYRSNPKQGKPPPKSPYRIPARSNRVKRGAVWTRSRTPTEKDIAHACQKAEEQRQQSRNAQPTIIICDTLRGLGVRFWREEITWHDGTKFKLSDFWLPDLHITIEANGHGHRYHRDRDAEKAEIILEQRNFRTMEYWNADIMKPDFPARLKKDLGL